MLEERLTLRVAFSELKLSLKYKVDFFLKENLFMNTHFFRNTKRSIVLTMTLLAILAAKVAEATYMGRILSLKQETI